MAPVKTTGSGRSQRRSIRKADSSSVSVPCETTTPLAPPSTAAPMAVRSRRRSAVVISGDGTWMNWIASTARPGRPPEAVLARSAAESDGTAPP